MNTGGVDGYFNLRPRLDTKKPDRSRALETLYWQASHASPFRIASILQAVFSASV